MSEKQDVVHGWQSGIFFECSLYLLMIAFGVLCVDTTVPDTINFLVVEYLDSALYSQTVGVLLIVTAGWQLVLALKKRTRKTTLGWHAGAGAVMCAVYTLGFSYLGFYTSTFFFLIAYASLVESPDDRDWKKKVAFSAVSVAILYAMFSLFKIYLPTTILP